MLLLQCPVIFCSSCGQMWGRGSASDQRPKTGDLLFCLETNILSHVRNDIFCLYEPEPRTTLYYKQAIYDLYICRCTKMLFSRISVKSTFTAARVLSLCRLRGTQGSRLYTTYKFHLFWKLLRVRSGPSNSGRAGSFYMRSPFAAPSASRSIASDAASWRFFISPILFRPTALVEVPEQPSISQAATGQQ